MHANVHGPDLPLVEGRVALLGAARARWATVPAALRAQVLRDGFGVLRSEARRAQLGAYYMDLRSARIPYVITLDALAMVAHMAIDRAVAEAEERVIAPALSTLLARLDARLDAEQRGAGGDLGPSYAIARGIVAVAQALLDPAYAPPPSLAAAVVEEVKRVQNHAGPSESPVLGVMIDYSQLAPRGGAGASDAGAAHFRAMGWLAGAPLMLVAGNEVRGAPLRLGRVRAHARAALLVARLLDPEVDAEAAHAWRRIAGLNDLVFGAPDDPSPYELARIAAEAGLDPRDARAIANVTRLDRARHAALDKHAPHLYDGAGNVRVPPGAGEASFGRAALSMRLFPASAAPDAAVLQSLVFPAIGALQREPAPATARDGVRAFPSALDVAAWLGATEARNALHASGDDAYAGYDAALRLLYDQRPPEGARHASIYLSALDAIATMLAPSQADPAQPCTGTLQWRRRKVEVALGAWTALRHDALPFARAPLAAARLDAAIAPAPKEPTAASLAAFVEPQPEAIAKLLALVRQVGAGIWAVGELPAASPARAVLRRIDDVLRVALAVAVREANDEALEPSELSALADMPASLAALDAALGAAHASNVSLVADVHTDLGPARALEEATGDLDDLYLVLREPRSGRMVLAVGASIPHYEFAQPSALRLTDEGWRARLHAGSPPPRDELEHGYVVEAAK